MYTTVYAKAEMNKIAEYLRGWYGTVTCYSTAVILNSFSISNCLDSKPVFIKIGEYSSRTKVNSGKIGCALPYKNPMALSKLSQFFIEELWEKVF